MQIHSFADFMYPASQSYYEVGIKYLEILTSQIQIMLSRYVTRKKRERGKYCIKENLKYCQLHASRHE